MSALNHSNPLRSIFAHRSGVSRTVRCTRCSSGGFGGLPLGLFGSSMKATVAPIYEDSNNPCNPDLFDYIKCHEHDDETRMARSHLLGKQGPRRSPATGSHSMSSTPKCLQNPTLRQVRTGWGVVVLDRTSPQDYTIYKDGVRLGRVYRARHWRAEGDDGYYSTRAEAISMAITTWYCARKARSC